MIELKHLGKTYETSSGSVTALRDIDLTIQDGQEYPGAVHQSAGAAHPGRGVDRRPGADPAAPEAAAGHAAEHRHDLSGL